ncbi:MAG TPA: TonB C-terminal domain-containing protein [Polyangiaceae bacterium]|nr:TonB C-terminal domain-containing protein [Polyangiaceae bacterium]
MSSRRLDPVAAPLLLWACAALVFHYVGYQGANEVASVGTDRKDLRAFASEARELVRPQASGPLEIALDGPIPTPEQTPPLVPVPPPPAPAPKPADAPKPPEPEKKKDEPAPKPEAPAPPTPPTPTSDKRVAVRQNVEDKDQPDNPNAKFAADEANHVKEESVARITSHDRNDRDTSPGANNQAGPKEEPGNAEKTRVADSEDRAGASKRPPGETNPDPNPAPPKPEQAAQPPKTAGAQPGQNGVSGSRPPPLPARPAPADPQRPDTDAGPGGTYAVNPRRQTAPEAPSAKASPATPPDYVPRLGGGPGPNGVNFNLSPGNAIAAVGVDELRRMRDADGERRRSAHRGSFKSPDLNRWRAQIENYVASVKSGNQTALNTARVPFATYLNGIHNRLHPLFADDYLATLDGLPNGHPLNRPELHASLEVVVNKEDGSIVRMGVVRTSGVTAFDAAALESMQRASPFGKPPSAIVSPDGNVYLHWEFHRNPVVACSTINARPFMLKGGAPADVPGRPPAPGPRLPVDPREPNRPPTREGRNGPPGGARRRAAG